MIGGTYNLLILERFAPKRTWNQPALKLQVGLDPSLARTAGINILLILTRFGVITSIQLFRRECIISYLENVLHLLYGGRYLGAVRNCSISVNDFFKYTKQESV